MTKDGYLKKPGKSELLKEVRIYMQDIQNALPKVNSITLIDFMAHARKLHADKMQLKTFGDTVTNLWNTFRKIGEQSNQIDIVFDLCRFNSIKNYERERRPTVDISVIHINQFDQPLPIPMESLWSSAENKVELQQYFIKWFSETYTDNKPV